MSVDHSKDQYEGAIALYDRLHEQLAGEEESDGPLDALWHKLALPYVDDVFGKRILEIGCGRGQFARYLAQRGARIVAADFSPVAVDITRLRLAPFADCEAIVADIQTLPFGDESFDVAISLETLEHVPDPARALAELVRVTRKGGQVIVTTPNYLNLYALYRLGVRLMGRRFREVGQQPINHPLTLAGRVRKLRRLGCRVDLADGIGHFVFIPGRGSVRIHRLDKYRWLRWFALESITVAVRI